MKRKKLIAFVLSAAMLVGSLSAFPSEFVFADENDETVEEPIEEVIPDDTDPDGSEIIEEEIEEPVEYYDPNSVAINETNFPDDVFRGYVSRHFDTDGNGELSPSEVAAVTDISVPGYEISDLTGIQYFTGLIRLDCGACNRNGVDCY
ncbi:MAG: hypothetical protein IKN80_00525, partial [Clostridiales bacterium]|nr:hypothetical protein [Clostridiales bacterium]